MDKAKWDYVLLLALIALLSRTLFGTDTSLGRPKQTDPLIMSWELIPFDFVSNDEILSLLRKIDSVIEVFQ